MVPLFEIWTQTNHYSEKGKMYFASSLIKAAKGLPVKKMRISNKLLDDKIYWTLNNFYDLKVHLYRIDKADLKYPIILGPRGNVIDGRHRLMKAVKLGQKTINYVKLDKMPSPDTFK